MVEWLLVHGALEAKAGIGGSREVDHAINGFYDQRERERGHGEGTRGQEGEGEARQHLRAQRVDKDHYGYSWALFCIGFLLLLLMPTRCSTKWPQENYF